jgi:hypothetical protein
MGARTAEEAIYELLGRHSRRHELVTAGAAGAPEPFHGRPWTADLGTLDILKQREVLGHRLFVVAFEAEHVRRGSMPMTILVRADETGDGWQARRITGVSGTGAVPLDRPHVVLGGSWGKHGFCGGGKVSDEARAVARVHLRFDNGVELEDGTDGGWVLFFTDRPVERPNAEVELVDADGCILSSFAWPWERDLPEELRRRISR